MQLAQPGFHWLLWGQGDAYRDGVNTQADQGLYPDQLGFAAGHHHAKEHLGLPTIATEYIGPTGLQERVHCDL